MTTHPAAIARIGISLHCDSDLLAESADHDHEIISQHAPTISLALQGLGKKATFTLCAELLQPTSPLLTDLLTIYAQLSIGAYVEARQGPPGTGKCTVIPLISLFKLIGHPPNTS